MYERTDAKSEPIEVKGLDGQFAVLASFQMSYQPASGAALAHHHLHVIEGPLGARMLVREEGVDADSGKMIYAVDSNCPPEIRHEVESLMPKPSGNDMTAPEGQEAQPGTVETEKVPANPNDDII
jgi:hypothetical protein